MQKDKERVKEAFSHVYADETLKRQTLAYLKEQRLQLSGREAGDTAPAAPAQRRRRWLPGAVCAAILILLCLSGIWALMPVSYVSMDVNPGIELCLSRFGRVVSARGYNETGTQIVQRLSLFWKTDEQAADLVIREEYQQGYLDEQSFLLVAVYCADLEKQEDLQQRLQTQVDDTLAKVCRGAQGQCVSADAQSVAKAKEYGLSFGKYQAIEVLLQLDPTLSLEQCAQMPMREIRQRIVEQGGVYSGNGQGCGNARESAKEQGNDPDTGSAFGQTGKEQGKEGAGLQKRKGAGSVQEDHPRHKRNQS